MIELFKEIFYRTRAAILILIAGDFVNGNIRRLEKALNEIDFIVEHAPDYSKEEIVELVASSNVERANTGLRHNIATALTNLTLWRLLIAEAREAEWHFLKQSTRSLVRKDWAIATVLGVAELEDIKTALRRLDEERRLAIKKVCDDITESA